jgi:hypothetical protein
LPDYHLFSLISSKFKADKYLIILTNFPENE